MSLRGSVFTGLLLLTILCTLCAQKVDPLIFEDNLILSPKAKNVTKSTTVEEYDIEPLTTSGPEKKRETTAKEETTNRTLESTGKAERRRVKRDIEESIPPTEGAESLEERVHQQGVWIEGTELRRYVRSSSEDKVIPLEMVEVDEDTGAEEINDQGEDEGSGFGERANDDSGYHPKSDQVVVELPQPPTPPPPPPPSVYSIQEHPASGSHPSAGLRGERGEQGPPGVCSAHCRDGTPGLPGPVGPEGRQGVAGQQGLPGPPGPPGPSGAVSGSYDGSGMRSIPGPAGPPGQSGPQGPQGVQGPRGDPGLPGRDGRSYEGLSNDDIERIVNDPRIKGEKGDSSGSFSSSSSSQYNSIDGPIEPYDPKKHRNQQKGQKGDPGVPGHPGHPGPAGPPGPPGRDAVGGGVGTVSSSGTAVYQTTVELFAAGRNLREGSLAFVTSSQQLFIRVTNGWKEILLGAFHPILEPRQSVEAPTSSSVPYHPVHAENLYAQADYSRAQNKDSPTSSSSIPHQPPHFPHSFPHTEYSRDASRAVQREEYQPQNKDRVLHMIALNTPFSGNMRGLRGADLQCYRQARQAGFGTTFRAMLSSKVQDLFRIVHAIDHNTPVVNLKGEVLFSSWSTVVGDNGVLEGKGVYAFNRQDVFTGGAWPDKRIWHGSTEGGLREDGAFCDGWRTASQYDSGLASTFSAGRPLVGTAEKVSCGSKLIVLCVENMSKYNVDRILAKKNVHSLD